MNIDSPIFDIIVTMGPSIKDAEVIEELIRVGATGFRFPFAKETPQWQIDKAQRVRSVANRLKKEVQLIMDLPGSKPRTLNDNPMEFQKDERISIPLATELYSDTEGSSTVIPISETERFLSIRNGDTIVFGDGEIAFIVEKVTETHITARALIPGLLGTRRGLTIEKDASVYQSISEKDDEYILLNSEFKFDCIWVSFVKTSEEIEYVRNKLRQILREDSTSTRICAKIETREAVRNVEQIIKGVDCVLVARGDLALQTGLEDFYAAQEKIIKTAKSLAKPVIVGTQLLETVARYWTPNRAELSDVCAILSSGVNGLLLSAETTIGKDPIRTVTIAKKLADRYSKKS